MVSRAGRLLARALLGAAAVGCLANAEEPVSLDLFDANRAAAQTPFVVVNDSVMGGVSTSRAALEGGVLVFSGAVRLENGGGFASMRTTLDPTDLSGFTGVELVVRGDGRRYKLQLRDQDDGSGGVVHRAAFETRAGQRLTLRVPFTDLEPSFRGRRVPDAPPLDLRQIRQLGVLISDRQAGPFRLEVLAIRVYR